MMNELPGVGHRPHAGLRDIPALVEFDAVARWEHVTRAAEEIGVPQPTLSRRIARLEQAVGVPLFTRRGRRLELTRAGRSLAAVVRRALGDLEQGIAQVIRSVDPDDGTVTLAFLHTLGVTVVPQILQHFRRLHPGIGFELTQDAHEAVLARLRRGEVDLCLTSPMPEEPGLSALPLQRQPLTLVVPADHPLAGRSEVALSRAAHEGFVGFKPGYGLRSITEDWCRRAGFTPRLTFEGEDVATVRGLAAAGLGVALLPASSTPAPGTVELTVTDPPASRTIALVTRTTPDLPPPGRAFHEFVRAEGPRLVAGQRGR